MGRNKDTLGTHCRGSPHALVGRIAEMILERHYSPYAAIRALDEEDAWPSGLRICEKTLDNGVEFSDVEGLERSCLSKGQRTTLFFAHPYCSSERGTNENHNGIIRRFVPKGSDIALVSRKEIRRIQLWMNTYPRKILAGSTPSKAFFLEFCLDPIAIKLMEVSL